MLRPRRHGRNGGYGRQAPAEYRAVQGRTTPRSAPGADAESDALDRNRLLVGDDGFDRRAATSKAIQRWAMPEGLLAPSSRPRTSPTQIPAEWQKLFELR